MLTVSLVHQREFNIHRAELEEQWDRKAAEKLQPIGGGSRGGGPAGSSVEASVVPTGHGGKRNKKRKKVAKGKL